MRPVAAMVAVVTVALTVLFGGVQAVAAPGSSSAGPAAAAPTVAGGLRLVLTGMSPRVVTADGPDTLTVAGMLVNDGPGPVTDVAVRVQRGDPLGTEGQVRDALDGDAATDIAVSPFQNVAAELSPGQQVGVHLSVPLRALAATGVQALLVNVNGTPERGARARLAAARVLLPVLGLPGTRDPIRAADPAPLTVLYPIADTPHRMITVPGSPPLLADDSLAASFAPTGRLGGLVAALAQRAPVGSPVRSGLCLAIDPDLVETASVMSQGYQILGPNGAIAEGAGAAAAGQWLAQLTAVAKGGCVVALPYADADLLALSRGGLTDAAARALGPGRQILSTLLSTPVPADVAWPADGVLDDPTLDVVQASGARSVLLSADAVTGRARGGVVPLAGRPLDALLTDPLLTRAATAPLVTPAPGPGAAATAASLAGDGGPLATQDLIGALAFRAAGSTPLVLAPPHQWRTDGAGARALLDAVGALVTAGEVEPVGLGVAATGASGVPVRPDPPVAAAEVPAQAIATLATAERDLTDLRSAVVDANVGITADQLFTPLSVGMLRGASAAYRDTPPAAQYAAATVLRQVAAIRNSIRVLEPPNPYALGSSDAPLPITVANALPVTVRVRVVLASTSGLRVNAIDVQQIPPLGRRQVSVNAQVTRAGQFTVDAEVRTPDGGLLGPPSHLKVRSTAYGTITGWLTAIAGVLLVLLAARRIWRRVRGEADRRTARTAPTPPPRTVSRAFRHGELGISTQEAALDPTDPTVRLPAPDPTGPTVRLPLSDPIPTPPSDYRPTPPSDQPSDLRPTAPLAPAAGRSNPVAVPPPNAHTPGPHPNAAPILAAPEDVAPTERLPRPPPPRP